MQIRPNIDKIILSFLTILIASSACQSKTIPPTVTPGIVSSALPSATWTPTVLPASKTPLPTQTLSYTPTKTPKPSSTSTATVTPTPTTTPFPALSQRGPYLAYERDNAIIVLNANGIGRKIIHLPEGGKIRNLHTAISPNGKWLAYHSALANWYSESGYPPELSLNLIFIPDGSTHLVTHLFPDNRNTPLYSYGNILAINWSADSRFLAFAGAMGGQSQPIELYVYDMETKAIRRLTTDTLDLWRIDWSPDTKKIWFENASLRDGFQVTSLYFMNFDETVVNEPTFVSSDAWTDGHGWISNDLYFLYAMPDGGCGPFGFMFVNTKSGQEKSLWGRQVNEFVLDREAMQLVVSTECGEIGTYLVDWDGQEIKISDHVFYELSYLGESETRYIGFDGRKVWGISKDGKVTELNDQPFGSASGSPDRHWYLLYQDQGYSYSKITGLVLYSETNQWVRTITEQEASPVIWRPDSAGMFFITEGLDTESLYYMDIPDGQPVLVDDCKPDGCGDSFVWLP